MHHDDVHLPQDCIEVLDWDHADVPGGYEGYSHVSRASIDLPISSDLLYFLGRGTLSHGVVRFVDSGATGASVANVNVTFLYDGYRLSDSLKICRLHKEGSKNGVGIFSPEVVHHLWNLHSMVVIEVTLPRSAAIKSLETFLPLFSHEVADFQDSVTFGSLALKSANMPIVAKYVATQRTNLQTSNSHISGIFVSNESIDISTSNSFIEGNFYLSNDGVSSTPSRINLHTSNSRIRARISLTSTAENHRNGSFNITTETNNSPLNVQFDTAPVDSRVTFIGRTTNSPISAKLHDSFEGTFSVTTGRWFEAGVHVVNTQDPSGRGRQRYVSRGVSQHGHSEGKVTWGDAGGRRLGHAELSTTNSPAQLYL
ncbi:hypothetical protein BDY19DRAFT_907895 [Irpex rosettiformis]|uniref:Uncharacterized protein n=1 Tax=Irpex rosettiformis TaxID=378272 RepID=A0ACB8TYH4_9APHY|nr:hypothetical protein BDY19DRAFT_907895 [Irpex rosettiformis]